MQKEANVMGVLNFKTDFKHGDRCSILFSICQYVAQVGEEEEVR